MDEGWVEERVVEEYEMRLLFYIESERCKIEI